MIERSSDKSVRELLIILLTMFQLPKGFSWKFPDFHGKEQKATSHTCPTCPWSCLSQNEKEAFLVRGPPFIVHPLLTCCFPVGNDRSLQSKQLPALHGMLMLSDHSPSTKLPESHLGSESDLQPISTELTFKPQPLIEHWVSSLCVCSTVPGSQGLHSLRWGEPERLAPNSHIVTDGRGSGAGLGEATSPNLKCTLYRRLFGHVL